MLIVDKNYVYEAHNTADNSRPTKCLGRVRHKSMCLCEEAYTCVYVKTMESSDRYVISLAITDFTSLNNNIVYFLIFTTPLMGHAFYFQTS